MTSNSLLHKYVFGCLCAIIGISSCATKQIVEDITVSFSSAAKTWEETFPLGNGRLGAMPTGDITMESIVINEESMWSGSVWDSNNPEAAKWLPAIREQLLEGNNIEAEKLMREHFVCLDGGGSNPRYGCYQTLGRLEIGIQGFEEEPSAYSRNLILNEGISKTVASFSDGTRIEKEYFVSLTDDVVIVHLKSFGKNLAYSFDLSREKDLEHKSSSFGEVQMSGHLSSGEEGKEGIGYFCKAVTLPVSINEAIIFMCAATTYNCPDPEMKVNQTLSKAKEHSYKVLKKNQQKAFRGYFDRVSVSLPDNKASLYLQFGRYLTIASTACATLPPNLQGIWAEDYSTAWNGDYHLNINLQMNCWPMETGNLSDLSGPITDYVENLVPTGEKTARTFYNSPGWTAAVLANAWQFTSPAEDPSWGSSLTGGAWISLQLWEHYLFSEDMDYLKRIYPTLKGAAEFLQNNLFEFPVNGNTFLVTGPSSSPENSFLIDGKSCAVCAGPYMDTEICYELFSAVIKASSILDTDNEFSESLKESLSRLAPFQISDKGYLQEWLEDYA
ncbi:MAG: glycoside hydrolase family 95 protein, partial [Bacteroidales bacterium]|nr:glycoside hydrolase family 95 protein [Bacteroidales bacterium]